MIPLSTAVIGSMPKPAYLDIPCWVKDGMVIEDFVSKYNKTMSEQNSEDFQKILMRATQEIIDLQEKAGITIITNGELAREQYIYNFCRNLNGFDFINKQKKMCRNGAWESLLPQIVSKICHRNEIGFMVKEWKWSQKMSSHLLKVTIPGPMTIIDTFYNGFYSNERTLFEDIVECINVEIKKLAEAGCKQIQVNKISFQSRFLHSKMPSLVDISCNTWRVTCSLEPPNRAFSVFCKEFPCNIFNLKPMVNMYRRVP